MKLFYTSGACSLSPHIVLREAGLDFSIEKVDLATKKTEHGEDFLKVNPKGQVPTLLLDDGSVLTEGVAIIQYIADQVPDRNLIAPSGTMARYHTIEWLNYIATELHKGFSPLFNSQTPPEYKTIARQKLEKQFQYVNSVLENQHFVLGSHFSIADAYLFNIMSWAIALQIDLSAYPAITDYLKRISERPAVSAALKAEGLIG